MSELIAVDLFGRDHWSALGYIECRCVDNAGVPERDYMRCNTGNHPWLLGQRQSMCAEWKPEYGTRLLGDRKLPEHDDWDCADDLEAAGFIVILGTGINPLWKMTDLGSETVSRIRAHKSAGGNFSDFTLEES